MAELGVAHLDGIRRGLPKLRAIFRIGIRTPDPVIAEPERRKKREFGRFRAAIHSGDANQDVIEILLGVFSNDVEVPALVENTGVFEFVFGIVARSFAVLFDELLIWETRVRITIEALQVGVGGRGIEIIVNLFDILAVIAFFIGQAKEACFENGIFAVPEARGEAEILMVVANAENAVFGPAVGARARLIVREVGPGGSIRAVVLANGSPGAFRKIGTPAPPMLGVRFGFREALHFGEIERVHRPEYPDKREGITGPGANRNSVGSASSAWHVSENA